MYLRQTLPGRGKTPRERSGRGLEQIGRQFRRDGQHGSQENGAAHVRRVVAQVLVARAAVFDAYVGRGVYGARAVVAAAVRRPRARPDDHQLSVDCNTNRTNARPFHYCTPDVLSLIANSSLNIRCFWAEQSVKCTVTTTTPLLST